MLLKFIRYLSMLTLASAVVAGCHGDNTSPPKPASIAVSAAGALTGTVGVPLAAPPTFVVNDESGHPMGGVSVSVAVVAGNGTLAGVPTTTTSGAPTSVGVWTLGPKVGDNQITVTVGGLPALTITAAASAGAAAKIVAATPSTISARVGDAITPAPSARVTDAFDNPIAAANVVVTLTGGGSAPAALVSDANGNVNVGSWTVGTTVGQSVLTLIAGAATTSFIANLSPGDPTQILVAQGAAQRSRAGIALPAPVVVRVADRFGNAVSGQSVTVAVTAGGGSIGASGATSAADGSITLPSWTLGKSAVPQTLHVASGALSTDVAATVQTDYHIDVRFFGPDMTDAQKALFTNAAARLSAIVVGDVPDVALTNVDVASVCGMPGTPILNETVDDIVIYASVQNIDGVGKILAQAGPCVFRNASSGYLTAVGVMEFDGADLQSLDTRGMLQDVITHEMLHVLGVGTLWSIKSLVQAEGTPTVAYYGLNGRQGCMDDGGTAICGTSVPVENNGVRGTADAHWRESTFQSELMTGYVNAGGMPLSTITIGSLGDIGYVVNPFAADPYRVPVGGASSSVAPSGADGWEKVLPVPGLLLAPSVGGAPVLLRREPR
ncbi:MAG: hypothetical protein JWM41_1261 [Gemmatimonadetes bacterium]|nr:hypothetical protein [Gemmatimonadota bacterium]